MKEKICLIYNYAQHYRTNIFTLMDKELSMDFVFGDKYLDVRKMDYNLLGNVKEVKNITFFKKPYYFQYNVLLLLLKYKTFIILGDLHCISTWIMLIFSKILGKKIYLWSHGMYGRENKRKIAIKKLFFNLSEGVFVYGNYSKKLMLKAGLNSEKISVIYNSLSYDDHNRIRQQNLKKSIYINHFKNAHKNIIFIGRLTKEKRLDLLLSALFKLKNDGYYYNLTIIGKGENESELIKLTRTFNLDNQVWFYGASYDENIIATLVYNSDLCVSPGNVGLTAIHAMTFGTPVITHNNFQFQGPEFEAIVEGKTGSFYEYNSLDSLSGVIHNWLKKDDREFIRNECNKIINNNWNPYYQIREFKRVLQCENI